MGGGFIRHVFCTFQFEGPETEFGPDFVGVTAHSVGLQNGETVRRKKQPMNKSTRKLTNSPGKI